MEFEYGTTQSFGSSIKTNPNYAYGYGTFTFNADLDNLQKGETYYYRLKGLDANNTVLYSDIASFSTQVLGVEIPNLKNNAILYPNPTSGVVNIDLPDNRNIISIIISDQSGKVFNYGNDLKTQDLKKINLSGKSTGIYYVRIIMDDKSVINRKVILK
ncbi:T9SS type A sorting domain-containing protein [Flavobacterium psychroterrae]|uniref:T9SS type A sorting domain-containing protein n=1 Tax=Flavobacterium psychroterrae TaxID=2133767 RepID=UPI003622A36C